MTCTVHKEVGRGSNAIVYEAGYPDLLHPDEIHTVLLKELFPYHPQGAIYRREDGLLAHTEEAEELWSRHRQSFEYGNRIHLRMQQRHPELSGENWNSFSCGGTLYTILGYTGGRSLAEEMKTPETQLRRLTERMLKLLDALEDFHREGYLHLDIAPDNILLIGRGARERVMLIDYNSVHPVGRTPEEAAFSMKPGYTAPEIRCGRYAQVCEATDLYSVTAVFFRCLNGAPLTPFQMIRPVPPDVSRCPALRESPESVKAMAQQILFSGLQSLPERRCASASEMRALLEELLERIDGVGVTHWALWEAGKKTVARTIRDNPAFSYLREGELFPSAAEAEGAAPVPTQRFIEGLLRPGAHHTLLTAPGGMGKSTALLRALCLNTLRYSPAEPAAAYIPLIGFQPGENSFLLDRLLEHLRFGADTRSYADARHRLRELLDQPLRVRGEERPVLLLLLDGLNEADTPRDALLREIGELAALRGVRILLTSRGGEPPAGFERAVLRPLAPEDVAARLREKGLLLPESAEMRELLRTPLMLSLFLRSAEAEGKQLSLRTETELIAAYFSSLTEKALRETPGDSRLRWQTEAAVSFVLPAIADALRKRARLSEEELLRVVRGCYGLFSSRILRRAFPRWIGHSRDIRGDCSTAEEWYGLIVHDLLWKRLGLLLHTERDGYQIPHQILRDYLATRHRGNLGAIRRRQALRAVLVSAAALLLAAFCFGVWQRFIRVPPPQPYDDGKAQAVLELATVAYADAANQHRVMSELLTASADPDRDEYESSLRAYERNAAVTLGTDARYYVGRTPEEKLNDALETGDVVSWSGLPLDADAYAALMALTAKRREDYAPLVPVLTELSRNCGKDTADHSAETNTQYYRDFAAKLARLLDYDAEITDRRMEQAFLIHYSDKAQQADLVYRSYLALIKANAHDDRFSDIPDSELPVYRDAHLQKLLISEAYRSCTG